MSGNVNFCGEAKPNFYISELGRRGNMKDERWDFYKGLLMFSVVLGHTVTALLAGGSDTV